jgi:hypothetical protein
MVRCMGWMLSRWAPVILLMILMVPGVLPGEALAEDVEVSSTFLTFFKKGGGYIEYKIKGQAAADLRGMIDDPTVVFPFETLVADGDGVIDQSEGNRYMDNLDAILTKRQIVLRGVKLDNVDVDEHRGLIGSGVNDTDELYLHITFRGHIQYDSLEFNVSGLEPLMVLYGSYADIPSTLTVDEKTYIVAAGLGGYDRAAKSSGTFLNLRAPMAAIVYFHDDYAVAGVPANRGEYDHSTFVGNPLALMILVFICTYLTIKLPKAVAKDNDMERVGQLHLGILILVILFWLLYIFSAAVIVWVFGIAMVILAYYLAYLIYAKNWRGIAEPMDGIDLGEAISAVDMAGGELPSDVQTTQTPTLLSQPSDDGLQPVVPTPGDEEVLVVVQDELHAEAVQQLGNGQVPGQVVATSTEPAPEAEQSMVQTIEQPPETTQVVAPPPAPVPQTPEPEPAAAEPPAPATKKMKCKCGGYFDVPLEPRPLEVQCPHCGTTGTLKQ